MRVGPAGAERPAVLIFEGADQVALLRRVRAAFDPHGLLNPSKLGS